MQAAGFGQRLLLLIVVALVASGGLELWGLLRFEPLGMDFLPLWAAGRMAWSEPGRIYDFAAVTAAQAWMLPPHFGWLRPYPYPPTTLLLLAPLGRLPFWAADAIWSTLSLAVFVGATARLAGQRKAVAAVLAGALPAVVIAASAGQTVMLSGGLIVIAVLELQRRPRLAGALLALAAIAKPQAALMAPVALVACGAFETLISAGLVAAAAVAASALLFGPARWSDWVASLPAFQQVVESVPRLGSAVITPLWAARELGLRGAPATVVEAAFALAGGWLTWTLFRKPAEPAPQFAAHRVAALGVGSLVAAPYAMCYDGALIAPAAAALVVAGLAHGRPVLPLLALATAYEITAPYLGLPALIVFAAVVIADWRLAAAPDAAASARMTPSGSRDGRAAARYASPAKNG
jgi:hypothetical protein